MQPYEPAIEEQMQAFYRSLNEKDRRRYAAIEARKLGSGGMAYMARVLGCDRHTIQLGMRELDDPAALAATRIRQSGGGRKRKVATLPGLAAAFVEVLTSHTAGSPTEEGVKWTNLTGDEIVAGLKTKGLVVSETVVRQLLREHGYVRRKAQKRKSAVAHADRAAQFTRIAELKAEYDGSPNPVISVDTKKKN